MNVFLVISVFGKVLTYAGPLPYDISECLKRISEPEAYEVFETAKQRGIELETPDGVKFTRKDVTLACELRLEHSPK